VRRLTARALGDIDVATLSRTHKMRQNT
jgi:hypothetical protein